MNFNELPSATLIELLLWCIGKRSRYKIGGDSMLPTLKPGQMVLCDRSAYKKSEPRQGDIVLAKHPQSGIRITKRVKHKTEDGSYFLVSDNTRLSEASDSRDFGAVSKAHIFAQVKSIIH